MVGLLRYKAGCVASVRNWGVVEVGGALQHTGGDPQAGTAPLQGPGTLGFGAVPRRGACQAYRYSRRKTVPRRHPGHRGRGLGLCGAGKPRGMAPLCKRADSLGRQHPQLRQLVFSTVTAGGGGPALPPRSIQVTAVLISHFLLKYGVFAQLTVCLSYTLPSYALVPGRGSRHSKSRKQIVDIAIFVCSKSPNVEGFSKEIVALRCSNKRER